METSEAPARCLAAGCRAYAEELSARRVLGDPRTVERNPSDRLEDRGEAAELVVRWVRHWDEHGFGYWCVRESGSDRIIGYAGVSGC